jgi:hypothetical protein
VKGVPFTLYGFRLSTPRLTYHKLIYTANQRGVVSDNLRDYVPNLGGRLPDPNGGTFIYLGIIQSQYLTQHVITPEPISISPAQKTPTSIRPTYSSNRSGARRSEKRLSNSSIRTYPPSWAASTARKKIMYAITSTLTLRDTRC